MCIIYLFIHIFGKIYKNKHEKINIFLYFNYNLIAFTNIFDLICNN